MARTSVGSASSANWAPAAAAGGAVPGDPRTTTGWARNDSWLQGEPCVDGWFGVHCCPRALPVLLLTMLVFFNGPAWKMAATVTRGRLWLALLFLVLIAASFLLSGMLGQVRPILAP